MIQTPLFHEYLPKQSNPVNLFWHAIMLFATLPLLWEVSAASDALPQRNLIRSGCEYNYPPYCMVTADSQADGFSVELLRASLKAVGHDVSFTTGIWDKVKQQLIDKKLQVLPLVGRTPERDKVFDFTFPYLRMHGAIVVQDDDSTIHSIDDLKNKTVAVMKGDNAEEFVRRMNIGQTVITTSTFEEALKGCAEKKYDAVIIQKLVALQLFSKMNLSTLKFAGPPLDRFIQNFCFAVSKGNRELLGLLNEGLSIIIADGTYTRLHTKWFAPIEAAAIKKNSIIIGGDNNYPPYEFIDEHGLPAGFNVDLTRAIAQATGLNVVIRLRPWSEIIDELDRGEIDAVHGMFYSTKRDSMLDFSPPHSVLGHVIVVRNGALKADDLALDSLKNRSVVVMRGDIMCDIARAHGLDKQLILVNSQEDALSLLAAGSYDCALVARVPALYWIKKHHWTNLQVSSRVIFDAEYCYSVLNTNDELLERLTEGLKTVESNGEFRRIYAKWLKIYDPPVFGIVDFIKYFSAVIIPVMLLLLLSLFWSRKLTQTVTRRTAALNREIIERTSAETRLVAEKEQLAITLRSIGEGVITTDTAGMVQNINGVAEQLCGVLTDSACGKPFDSVFQLVHEQTGTSAESPLKQLLLQQQTIEANRHILLLHRDGSKRHVAYVGSPIYNRDHMLSGTVFVFRDITEQQKLIDVMQRNAILESLGVLAGGIAHDFNNLMGGVFGYIDMALDATVDNAVSSPLSKAISLMDRAQLLTSRLLTFAKGGAPVCTAGAITPLIRETTQRILKGSSVSCTFAIDNSCSSAMFDALQITQVVEQLVINAKEAMPSGGMLTVTARNCSVAANEHEPLSAGNYIEIMLSDTGAGISPQILPRIFDPFFSTKSNHKGLGLSICHSIISKHDGSIEVESEVGKGTSVHVFIPAIKILPTVTRTSALSSHSGTGTVLVMDDEAVLRDIIGIMLRRFGYNVLTFDNGEDAVSAFTKDFHENRSIIAMIFDLTIPGGMGGKEAVAEIRKLDPVIPVFVASGYNDDPVMAHPDTFGFTGSISKPFRKDELGELLDNHFGNRMHVQAKTVQ